ncbi:MAG: hypothetical protein ACOYM2_06030 [Rectinemataceae bacterium]
MTAIMALGEKFAAIWPQLGCGGVTVVSKACGLSRVTITKALEELAAAALETGRIRKPGGCCRSLIDQDPGLLESLEALEEPLSLGSSGLPLLTDYLLLADLVMLDPWLEETAVPHVLDVGSLQTCHSDSLLER